MPRCSSILVAGAVALVCVPLAPTARAETAGAASGAAASKLAPEAWKKLTGRLEEVRTRHGVTALIVGVGRGDTPPVVAAADRSITGVPARTDMHFRMGAMAIAAQTTILMQMVDEGLVRLEDPLAKWLPTYPEAGKITLQMLADSTAGYGPAQGLTLVVVTTLGRDSPPDHNPSTPIFYELADMLRR